MKIMTQNNSEVMYGRCCCPVNDHSYTSSSAAARCTRRLCASTSLCQCYSNCCSSISQTKTSGASAAFCCPHTVALVIRVTSFFLILLYTVMLLLCIIPPYVLALARRKRLFHWIQEQMKTVVSVISIGLPECSRCMQYLSLIDFVEASKKSL